MSYRSSLSWTGQVFAQWGRWTRGNWRLTLVLSAAAFVVGWIWNTYILAVDLGGSEVGPDTETTATAEGHSGNIVYWLILFSLIGGLVSYAWSRGWSSFGSDVLSLPRRLGEAITRGPAVALAMVLWGMSISLIISTLIAGAVSAVLGLVLLTLAATPIGVVLNFALIRMWRGLVGVVAPNAGARLAGMLSPFMVMVGEALGLFVDWMVGAWLVGLVLAVVCAVGSMLIVRGAPRPRAAALLVFVGAVAAMEALHMRMAYADDGGWTECVASDGSPCTGIGGLFDWLSSPGADVVIARGAVGGIGAAVGALLGAGLGAGMAGLAAATSQATATATAAATNTTTTGPASGDTLQRAPGEPGAVGGGTEAYPSAETATASVSEAGQASGATQPTSAPPIPHQNGWPDTSPHSQSATDQEVSARAAATEPHGDADLGSQSPLQSDGERGADAARTAPYLDVQDLLPEEPEKKRRDGEVPPENPPRVPPQP
jgi:hypothetical protein